MKVLAALLIYTGLIALAFAMSRHHHTTFQRDIPPRLQKVLCGAGWLLLAGSVGATIRAHGAEIGAVAWFATVACFGFAITLLLAFVPRLWPLPLAALLLACLIG